MSKTYVLIAAIALGTVANHAHADATPMFPNLSFPPADVQQPHASTGK